jgi:drug/metabolite transporter (DMT)-like permease
MQDQRTERNTCLANAYDPIGERRALVPLLAGAVLISFSSVFVRLAEVAPTLSGFYRVMFGALFLGLAAGVRRLSWRTTGRVYGLLALCGLFFALDLYFWHISILSIGPGLATIISNFQVFFLGFVGVALLGEPLGRRLMLAVPLALSGLVMIVGIGWAQLAASYRLGLVFALVTALCYAAYLLTLRKTQSLAARLDPLAGLTLISLVSALLLGLQVMLEGGSFAIPNLRSLGALAGLGLGSQSVGWVLITRALPRIRASLVGLSLMMQPALAFVWDMLFFQRPTTGINLAGVALTLGAIYLGSTTSRKPVAQKL